MYFLAPQSPKPDIDQILIETKYNHEQELAIKEQPFLRNNTLQKN